MKKPIQVKPAMYALFYENLKLIAFEYGYNLLLHGSLNRDMDLVAVPWIDNPSPEIELVQSFDNYFRGTFYNYSLIELTKSKYQYSKLPGGRNSYVINLNRGDKGGEWGEFDEQYYLDISITPLVLKEPDLIKINA